MNIRMQNAITSKQDVQIAHTFNQDAYKLLAHPTHVRKPKRNSMQHSTTHAKRMQHAHDTPNIKQRACKPHAARANTQRAT